MNWTGEALQRVSVLIVNYNAGKWLARAVEPFLKPESFRAEIIIVDNGSSDDSLQRLAEMNPIHPHPNPPPWAEASFGADKQACPSPRAEEGQTASHSQVSQENPPPPLAGESRGGGGNESGGKSEGNNITIDRAKRNLGFAAGINRAATHATGEFLLLLNPDCRIEPAALVRLVAELDEHPEAALASGKVIGRDGREQRGSRRKLPTPARIIGETLPFLSNRIDLTRDPAPEQALKVEAVSGACMLIRAEVFRAIGGMDEGYPLHFEDLDLFARLGASGWTLRWVPDVEIEHVGAQSSRTRPAGVVIDKHRGLWRYLKHHCDGQWPRWQRPLWALALMLHLCLRVPIALTIALTTALVLRR